MQQGEKNFSLQNRVLFDQIQAFYRNQMLISPFPFRSPNHQRLVERAMATRIVRVRQGGAVPLPASREAVFHLRQLPAFLHQLRLCFGSFVPHLSFLLIQILQDLYPARTTREKTAKLNG
jgi:hypothetical protein